MYTFHPNESLRSVSHSTSRRSNSPQMWRALKLLFTYLACSEALSFTLPRPKTIIPTPPKSSGKTIYIPLSQDQVQHEEICIPNPEKPQRQDSEVEAASMSIIVNDTAQCVSTPVDNKREAIINVVCGILGSAVGEVVAYPVDVVKTRLQSSSVLSSPLLAISELVNERGIGGVYAGLPSPLLGCLVIKAFVFGGYEISKRLVRKFSRVQSPADVVENSSRPLTFIEGIAAAFGAGIFAAFAYCPIDRVKIALQLAKSDNIASMTTHGTFLALAKGGTLFHGLTCCLAREAPYNACYFTLYERSRDWAIRRKNTSDSKMAWWVTPVIGGLAGVVAWIVVLPADVAKTRVQAGLAPNFWVAILNAFNNGSILNGMSAVIIRALLKHSVTFTIYEKLRPTVRNLFTASSSKMDRLADGQI